MGQGEAVFIERWAVARPGPTVAVKDLVDVEGSVTTGGCLALSRRGLAATTDAACVARVREAGGVLVGKTNLHELAYGTSGANPWFGTPVNPLDPGRVPGGSSSGSAVAVALGECDVALGSDTGGSVRIPAACCGVVGLKTTWGRVPLEGVWPLAPSFDTVGPLARSVDAARLGLALLDGRRRGTESTSPAPVATAGVGRVRLGRPVRVDPLVDEAVDRALAASELPVDDVAVEGWPEAWRAHQCLLGAEAWASDRHLVEADPDGVGEEVRKRLIDAGRNTVEDVAAAEGLRGRWTARMREAVGRHGVLALATIPWRPPLLDEPWQVGFNFLTSPVSLCGFPAVSVPVPMPPGAPSGWRTTGLQLVGPPGAEEALLGVAAVVEAAVGGSAETRAV